MHYLFGFMDITNYILLVEIIFFFACLNTALNTLYHDV